MQNQRDTQLPTTHALRKHISPASLLCQVYHNTPFHYYSFTDSNNMLHYTPSQKVLSLSFKSQILR